MKNKLITYLLLFSLLISLSCCASASPEHHEKFVDMSKKEIKLNQFSKENSGIKFNNIVSSANNFEVTKNKAKHSVHISMLDESKEIPYQTIGVPLSDLPGFIEHVQITHYNESGVNDYTQIVKPAVVNGVAYIDVEFTEVTITPYISLVKNWSFENWSQPNYPDDWIIYGSDEHRDRSTDAVVGSYSHHISGGGPLESGSIEQSTNYTEGTYKVGCWIKRTSGNPASSSVVQFIDPTTGTRDIIFDVGGSFDWTWYEGVVELTLPSPYIHVWMWNGTNINDDTNFDGLVISPEYSFSATETVEAYHLHQNLTYTPTAVNTPSTFITEFESVNITDYPDISVVVTVDGSTRTAWIDRQYVYFDSSGLSTSAHNVNITVAFVPPSTVASFNADDVFGAAPHTVHFTGSGTNSPTAWAWNFGDGATSTSQNPTHAYTNSGIYTVSLTVTNAGGSDTETKTGYITAVEAPIAAFTWSRPSTYTYGFIDQSAETPASWAWEFGDGATSNIQNPTHTYAGFGVYAINLTVTNEAGQSAKTNNLTIAAMPTDVISPVGPEWQYVAYNQSVEFNYTTPYGVLVSHWYINGNEINSTGLNLSYTFADPGRATNVSCWIETTEGNSSMIEYRTMTGREVATEHLVPSNSTTYEDLENSLMDLNTSGILTYSFKPYTDLIGRMAYCVIFILPFIFIWFQTGKMTLPTTLSLITGAVFIGFVPSQFTAFIGIAIVLSFAGNFYKLSRGP